METQGQSQGKDKGYDPADYSLFRMAEHFYSRPMLPVTILVWIWFLIFLGIEIWAASAFCKASETQNQIMYAAIFICVFQFFILIKVFSWQFIHRDNIKQDIRRLENKIDEMKQ